MGGANFRKGIFAFWNFDVDISWFPKVVGEDPDNKGNDDTDTDPNTGLYKLFLLSPSVLFVSKDTDKKQDAAEDTDEKSHDD